MKSSQENEVKWIAVPPTFKAQKPFVQGRPSKHLSNGKCEYQIELEGQIKTVVASLDQTFEVSKSADDYQDMCEMSILNEPEVLNNLIRRYNKEKIFTYIGPTLIVLNPYRILPAFFGLQVLNEMREKILQEGSKVEDPHVYTIAGKAFKNLMTTKKKQAIVISGESGAGKTESTKYCMRMLTSLSHRDSQSIESKILACNPLLEAFGNSKTVRNDNSSRFGKYVQIYFGDDHTIKGANIFSYLLEKSRVVSISKNERSFHAFYALTCSGKYSCKSAKQYEFLKQSGCYEATNMNDKKYFDEINSSMKEIGFTDHEIDKIWKLVKSVLQLGNADFDETKHQQNESNPCEIRGKVDLKEISATLQIPFEQLQKLLLYERKKFLKQFHLSAYNKHGCVGHLNTLCKGIYNAIFEFILHKIQKSLNPKQKQKHCSINILDIFGFQNFEHNSFEQLCINFTNEKLLKLYNKYIFEREMQLLVEDGLGESVSSIHPPTNDLIIDLISENKISVFSIINDFTPQQQYKDSNMIESFRGKLAGDKNIKFNKIKPDMFTIVHSQCEVTYDINGFKAKNLDRVNTDVQEVINNLFEHKSKQQAGRTLLSKFCNQIEDLIKELSSSNVHFIRCIKPNELKMPNLPVDSYILTQVRYLGVFETIQIRKKTFPSRKSYPEFIAEYKALFPETKGEGKERVHQMLQQIKCEKSEFMLGNKRVYVNQRVEELLSKMIYEYFKLRNEQIIKIQQTCQRFRFTSKVSRKLKLLVQRKNIWRSFGQKKLKELLKTGFSAIQQVAEQKKVKLAAEQKKKKEAEEKIKKQQRSEAEKEKQKKRLETINQKFFRYSKVILRSQLKLSLHHPFSLIKGFKMGTEVDPNETVIVESPIKSQKKVSSESSQLKKKIESQKPPKENNFSESFYNEQPTICFTSKSDVIFSGSLVVAQFKKDAKSLERLENLRDIINEKKKASNKEGELCSPASQDGKFQVQDCPNDIMNKILSFPIDKFFEETLRKRTTFIGMKKDYTDILVFKPKPLNKSLIELEPQEETQALKVFKLLIKISEETALDNVFKLVESVILYCQQTSPAIKNQVFLQMLKQSNCSSEVAANRIYQTLSVFLHIYTPEEEFLLAGLYLFFNKLAEKKYHEKEEEYLRYLFKKMIRKIQKPHGVGYMPIKYQMMALMSKRQISVPIYLPVGNSVLVKVESYHTFADIKQRALQELCIDTSRLKPEFFAFFEVINFENEELEESPVSENSLIWDVMTYWELAKVRYEESGISPPSFFIMIKVKYLFECAIEDEEAIEIYFSQCFFDYSLGRIKLEVQQMGFLGACSKVIKSRGRREDINGCFPFWMIKKHGTVGLIKMTKQYIEQIESNFKDLVSVKFKFLEICSECPISMSLAIPTDHPIKLFMRPKRIYLVEKGEVLNEYSIRQIAKWSNDKEKFTFEIRKKDGKLDSVTHVIYSEYAQMCTEYLNKVSELLMKFGAKSKAAKTNKILNDI